MNIEERPPSDASAMPAAADEPVSKDPVATSAPTPPDQTSGNAVPAPLAKEDELRADDVKQSAEELKIATEELKVAIERAHTADERSSQGAR